MKKKMKAVSKERWIEAQKWENRFWNRYVCTMKSIKNLNVLRFIARKVFRRETGDDSNHWWKREFDNYNFLPAEMENIIEFGCGPFTNLRLITEGRKIRYIYA